MHQRRLRLICAQKAYHTLVELSHFLATIELQWPSLPGWNVTEIFVISRDSLHKSILTNIKSARRFLSFLLYISRGSLGPPFFRFLSWPGIPLHSGHLWSSLIIHRPERSSITGHTENNLLWFMKMRVPHFQNRHDQPFFLISSSSGLSAKWLMLWVR
jgi:hypothetical protein